MRNLPVPLLPHPQRSASILSLHSKHQRLSLPNLLCSFVRIPKGPTLSLPFPWTIPKWRSKEKGEKRRRLQLIDGSKSCSWHVGSVLCFLASSGLENPSFLWFLQAQRCRWCSVPNSGSCRKGKAAAVNIWSCHGWRISAGRPAGCGESPKFYLSLLFISSVQPI